MSGERGNKVRIGGGHESETGRIRGAAGTAGTGLRMLGNAKKCGQTDGRGGWNQDNDSADDYVFGHCFNCVHAGSVKYDVRDVRDEI